MISTGALRRVLPTLAFAAFITLGLGLSSCISLFPKTPPVNLYRFEAQALPAQPQAARQSTVLTAAGQFPSASAGDRLLTVNGSQVAYIAGARWVSAAATLFNDAVVRALQTAPSVRQVAMGELSRPDYILRIDVLTFETRYLAGPQAAPTVVIQARASLTNARNRTPAGMTEFQAAILATDNHVSAIVAAYDTAMTQIMGELRTWLAETTAA